MKGGYQILDLTGATAGSPVEVKGIYKAAAGNNGKPVMILTNDGQRVYAEIAEDDGDFITCYISAEGKTVNITIKSDDSVTTVVSDPGASITGLEQAVNEIAGNIGDVDDLTTTSKVVVGAVNELNSKILTQDITSQVTVLHGKIKAYKTGNVVMISWDIGEFTIPTGATLLVTGLPNPCLPASSSGGSAPFSPFYNSGGNGQLLGSIVFSVNSNGDLQVANYSGNVMSGSYKGTNMTYICQS